MNLFVERRMLFNHGQEWNPLLIGVLLIEGIDNLAGADILCREQSGRSVAFVIGRFGRTVAWRARQAGLGARKCLDLTLFVRRPHNRVGMRIQVEGNDICGLFGKKRVIAQFKRLHPMWLQLLIPPDTAHRASTYFHLLGQTPCAPMSGIARSFLDRLMYDLGDFLGTDRTRPTRSRRVVQPFQPLVAEIAVPNAARSAEQAPVASQSPA